MSCHSAPPSSPSLQKIRLFKHIINSETWWGVCATSDPSSRGEDKWCPTQRSSDCQGSRRAHPQSGTRKAWTNQFFQPFPVSHVFQATTMPHSPPHSPASALEQWDAVLHPAQP